MSTSTASFIKMLKNPFKFRFFLFTKLPSAYFAGVRVSELDADHCAVSVPFKWFSQNPFRSTYFACLSMAAEMSTGALAMAHIYNRKPAVSMLVVSIHGEFLKKATGKTWFTCFDGKLFEQAISESISTGEARTVKARSVGKNHDGEVVAEFFITWSFKAKSKPSS